MLSLLHVFFRRLHMGWKVIVFFQSICLGFSQVKVLRQNHLHNVMFFTTMGFESRYPSRVSLEKEPVVDVKQKGDG